MLVSYEFKLDIKEEKNYKIYNWGSALQGVLLENIDNEYVDKLHNTKYNPYSQYVFLNKDHEYIWRISTIGKEAFCKIFRDNILNRDKIFIKNKNLEIKILEKQMTSTIELDELFKKWFIVKENLNKIKYKIITPISYKYDNKYLIIPDIGIILSNLINKWNAFSNNSIDKNAYEEYLQRTFISNYNTRSTTYSIEKIKIKGYIGEIEITTKSNNIMTNILNMLFDFAEYTGLGIKTSMGMGGIKLIRKEQ